MKTVTIRQERAARLVAQSVVLGDVLQKNELLKQAGYSKKVQENPSRVFDSAGFKAALNRYLTVDTLLQVHASLLESQDPSIQMRAVKLGYKVHGVGV
jgi:hypothetical protein